VRWGSDYQCTSLLLLHSSGVHEATKEERALATELGWLPSPTPGKRFVLRAMNGTHRAVGVTELCDEWDAASGRSDSPFQPWTANFQRFGWPMRCLEATVVRDRRSGAGECSIHYYGGALLPWTSSLNASGFPVVVPYYPIWPGLLVNAAFYGAIFWLLWFGPGMIRRGRRRRRGLCARCGYELRGFRGTGGTCPECGGGSS
jgi:hypothetical protein